MSLFPLYVLVTQDYKLHWHTKYVTPEGPQVNKFEQVSSVDHKMSLLGWSHVPGWGCGISLVSCPGGVVT